MLRIICIITSMLSSFATYADHTVIKSPIDQKQYRYLELDNRLKVMLVSDGNTDKSAASLDINIGNGSDPDNWQGLAHFLEHILFLGTKKYPVAGEYQEFIKNNGGDNNAYTSFSHTNYYFSIANAHFEPALDRFSRFFIDPAFDEVYVDRERSVVHSEYQARKKDEGRRLWDAQKQWIDKAHPSSRFSVGSLETLRDREESTVREKLIDFYGQFYSANIMTLTVLGNEPLDKLEKWVRQRFADIPDNNVAAQLFDQPYLNPKLIPARLNTIPEKEQNTLRFIFPVPSTTFEYKSKPLSYIGSILGHEGVGSLYAILKERGWAEGLSAGRGYMDNVQGEFRVQVQLTVEGLKHIEDIGALLFETIALIKELGIERWRFDEHRQLSEISFRFAQETDPGRFVQSMSSSLHIYPTQDVLQGPYLIEKFEFERIKELLGYLSPEKVNIHVTSQSLETDKTTEYYDVDYSLTSIDPVAIKRWQDVKPSRDISLPERNQFIPERLELLELNTEQTLPKSFLENSEISNWYRPDNEFETPRANFYFNVMMPIANDSPEHMILTELFVGLVNSQLNKTVYPAYVADLNYSLYRHARGLSVRISGFEDKQSELLKLVVDALEDPEYDIERFEIIKARLVRKLENVSKDSPSNQVVHEIYRLLMRPYWTEQERIEVLQSITIDDVKSFVPELFKQVKVVVLSHGDVSQEASRERKEILDRLLVDSQFVDDISRPTIHKLNDPNTLLRTMSVEHSDSALAAYFQGGNNSRIERARLSLLRHLLESSFYNLLRTVNRVGYIVHATTLTIDETPGLLFSVQSPTHSPIEIKALYDEFIDKFVNELEEMETDQFSQIQDELITKILRKDKNLNERTQRYWREIDREELAFNTRSLFAEAVSSLTFDDMRSYFKENIVEPGAGLLVQTAGIQEGTGFDPIPEDGYKAIGSTEEFRQLVN